MALSSNLFTFIKSSFSTSHFYKAMNFAFNKMYGNYNMLHFPIYNNEKDNLLQAQMNLTNYCVSRLPSLKGKKVLDIGCGNGVQSIYLYNNFSPKHVVGVDINNSSISIAKDQKKKYDLDNIEFYIDNAQNLTKVRDNSIDIILNIESAFHYPDKVKFINEISRVLKPNGHFLIADIITTKKDKRLFPGIWYKKMNLHHWSVDDYNKTFFNSELSINFQDDITELIINGFRKYKNWFPEKKPVGIILYFLIKIFVILYVRINIFLFKNRRKYLIFTGIKS